MIENSTGYRGIVTKKLNIKVRGLAGGLLGQRGKCVGKIVKECCDLSSTLLKNITIKPVKQKNYL